MDTSQFFRAGVGAIILNTRNEVLACERRDHPGAWQLPQGGIETGENSESAVYREIREETGIDATHLSYHATYPDWLAYELPTDKQSTRTGRGQVQHWFLFRGIGDIDSAVAIHVHESPEFRDYQWMNMEQLVDSVIAFRRPVYEKLAHWLASVT